MINRTYIRSTRTVQSIGRGVKRNKPSMEYGQRGIFEDFFAVPNTEELLLRSTSSQHLTVGMHLIWESTIRVILIDVENSQVHHLISSAAAERGAPDGALIWKTTICGRLVTVDNKSDARSHPISDIVVLINIISHVTLVLALMLARVETQLC